MERPTVTKKELSEALGVSLRQIENLVAQGMPRIKKGRRYEYPYAAITWYYHRKIATLEGQRPPALDEAKARKELAQAELAEFSLQQARGNVVPRRLFLDELSAALYRLRAGLLNIPSRFTPMMVGLRTYNETKLRLEQVTQELMLELTRTAEDIEHRHDDASSNGKDAPKRKRGKPAGRKKRAQKNRGRSRKRDSRAAR